MTKMELIRRACEGEWVEVPDHGLNEPARYEAFLQAWTELEVLPTQRNGILRSTMTAVTDNWERVCIVWRDSKEKVLSFYTVVDAPAAA